MGEGFYILEAESSLLSDPVFQYLCRFADMEVGQVRQFLLSDAPEITRYQHVLTSLLAEYKACDPNIAVRKGVEAVREVQEKRGSIRSTMVGVLQGVASAGEK